jgi:predicted pyridoxine 5'-phosphate oxidase superfamily flavin-nucleotide-binding protein
MFNDLKRLAESNNHVAVGATVDRHGVPQITRIVILDIDEEREEILFYDANNSASVDNLQYNPKVSLSITNVKIFDGRQVKGLGDVVLAVAPTTSFGRRRYADAIEQGVKYFVRLRIAEMFDVVPKEKSVRNSEQHGSAFSEYDKINIAYPTFSPSMLQPQTLDGFKEMFNPFLQAQFEKRSPGFVGTVEFRGAPNISPRWIVGAEENFILWGDLFKNKTFFNFSRPSPIAVYSMDWETGEGMECQGWAKFFFFGKSVARVNEAWISINQKFEN